MSAKQQRLGSVRNAIARARKTSSTLPGALITIFSGVADTAGRADRVVSVAT
jgi:hypothetical protein